MYPDKGSSSYQTKILSGFFTEANGPVLNWSFLREQVPQADCISEGIYKFVLRLQLLTCWCPGTDSQGDLCDLVLGEGNYFLCQHHRHSSRSRLLGARFCRRIYSPPLSSSTMTPTSSPAATWLSSSSQRVSQFLPFPFPSKSEFTIAETAQRSRIIPLYSPGFAAACSPTKFHKPTYEEKWELKIFELELALQEPPYFFIVASLILATDKPIHGTLQMSSHRVRLRSAQDD